MHPAPYRKQRGVYDTYIWYARAARHAPGVSPERVAAIADDSAALSGRFRLVLPHDTACAFYLREDLEARIAAFEAEGIDWHEGVD
ncbi:hypothetical protein MMB17_05765 [Methylobacterium organophilum]|uniref:hypothetical protein n=1 Tax=Methylobacterium organophilum TaxID=410 RepID=UPI001F1483F3|nr:hypothetical protein [Methylobacterium organophilum]UMY18821.1 hypothetical protein MMB17_05765 [Methylobacterium organophilum]